MSRLPGACFETTEITEFAELGSDVNKITEEIIGAAIAVHRELGAGLLESAYEACLAYGLVDRGLSMERQKELPVIYRNKQIDLGYRIDLLVEGMAVVELKAVAHLEPVHEAQILSYLKLSGYRVGWLINFNVSLLKDGIRRFVYGPNQ